MKRYLFAALLMAAPLFVFAQLKVDANGHVAIGDKIPHINSDLLLGNTPYLAPYRNGIQSRYDFPNDTIAMAVTGMITTDDITGRTIGVYGYSNGGTRDRHFGTYGGIGGGLQRSRCFWFMYVCFFRYKFFGYLCRIF